MKLKALLIDFGATRIKSAILDLENGAIVSLRDWEMFNVAPNSPERYEIPTEWLTRIFCDVCNHYYNNAHTRFQSVFLCSQMHGFIVADDKNVPQTNYISWRDHRSQVPDAYGQTSFELLQHALAKHLPRQTFRAITGMPLPQVFPSPIFSIGFAKTVPMDLFAFSRFPIGWHAARTVRQELPTLRCLQVWASGTLEHKNATSNSSRSSKRLSALSLSSTKRHKQTMLLVSGSPESNLFPFTLVLAIINAQLLGADNQKNSLSFNIGTGSQVSRIIQTLDDNEDSEVENRPFFGKKFLRTITHIPGGRVLALFASLLQNPHHEMPDEIWKLLGKMSLDEVLNSKLTMNLSFFPGSWRYNETGGSIGNITEHSWNYRSYLASLLRCFAVQYVQASRLVVPNRRKCD